MLALLCMPKADFNEVRLPKPSYARPTLKERRGATSWRLWWAAHADRPMLVAIRAPRDPRIYSHLGSLPEPLRLR